MIKTYLLKLVDSLRQAVRTFAIVMLAGTLLAAAVPAIFVHVYHISIVLLGFLVLMAANVGIARLIGIPVRSAIVVVIVCTVWAIPDMLTGRVCRILSLAGTDMGIPAVVSNFLIEYYDRRDFIEFERIDLCMGLAIIIGIYWRYGWRGQTILWLVMSLPNPLSIIFYTYYTDFSWKKEAMSHMPWTWDNISILFFLLAIGAIGSWVLKRAIKIIRRWLIPMRVK